MYGQWLLVQHDGHSVFEPVDLHDLAFLNLLSVGVLVRGLGFGKLVRGFDSNVRVYWGKLAQFVSSSFFVCQPLIFPVWLFSWEDCKRQSPFWNWFANSNGTHCKRYDPLTYKDLLDQLLFEYHFVCKKVWFRVLFILWLNERIQMAFWNFEEI